MDYQATEQLLLNAGMTYNKAEASWDWNFSERDSLIMAAGDFNYDTWDMNNLIDTYSDLSYEQYQFNLGGTYNFTQNLYTTASVTYDVFKSDEMYVYGDEDGDAYYGYLGVGYRF